MKKIISYIKSHKKPFLWGSVGVIVVIGLGLILSWNCIQFNHYCKEKDVCACAGQKLSRSEKKAYVAIAKYMKQTGRSELDAGILKYTTAEELTEVGLKIKACSADVSRQAMLNNYAASKANFPGDYNCMRQVVMNELSNEEVLFLQSPQSKSLQALQIPAIREMYLVSSAKLMKCMNEQVQKQYRDEVEKLKALDKPKKRAKKAA